MKLNLLATTAVAALLASGTVWAQAQAPEPKHNGKAPQMHEQKAQAEQKAAPGKQDRAREEQARKENDQAKGAAQHAQEQKGNAGRDLNKTAEQPAKDNAKSARGTAAEKQDRKQAQDRATAPGRNTAAEAKGKNESAKDKTQAAKDNTAATKSQAKDQTKTSEQQKTSGQKAAQSKQNTDQSKPGASPGTSAANNTKSGTSPATQKQNAQNQQPSSQSTTQAKSSGTSGSMQVSESDRSKIFSTLKSGRQASRQNINIDVNVGTRLPARAHLRPLPSTIVRTMPQFRGYDYVMVRDEIAIVRPGTREVVEVIREPGTSVAATSVSGGMSRGSIHLTDQQRTSLRTEARRFKTSQVSGSGSQCFSLQPVPSSIVSANPDLRSMQMLAIGDEVILVDPSSKKIVDVIQ